MISDGSDCAESQHGTRLVVAVALCPPSLLESKEGAVMVDGGYPAIES